MKENVRTRAGWRGRQGIKPPSSPDRQNTYDKHIRANRPSDGAPRGRRVVTAECRWAGCVWSRRDYPALCLSDAGTAGRKLSNSSTSPSGASNRAAIACGECPESANP